MEEPLHEKLELNQKWGLWEHYETAKGSKDYTGSLAKVAWFNDLFSFAEAWQHMQHREIANYFYNEKDRTIPVHPINGEEKRVNGFSLFGQGIRPEWEDEINANGGSFKLDFKAPSHVVQQVWEKLVFQTVTWEFKEADKLCGVRLLDKSQPSKEGSYRIEVWTQLADENDDSNKKIKTYLEDVFVAMINDGCKSAADSDQQADWGARDHCIQFGSHKVSDSKPSYKGGHGGAK